MASLQRAINAGKIRENVCWFKKEGMLLFWTQSAEQATQISEGKCLSTVVVLAKSEGIHPDKDYCLLVYPGHCLCEVELCFGTIWGQSSIGGGRNHIKPSSIVLVQALGAAEIMVRPRERMPCRRGSGRGESSRHPAADVHHHCCCCYCHRRAGATPIQASHFMEADSSNDGAPLLPAFGSVIFTLGSSRDNAGINAHISVLFTKAPEEDEEGTQPVAAEVLPEGSREKRPVVQPTFAKGNPEKELQQSPTRLQEQEKPATAQDPMAMWAGIPEGQGWSRIIEEKPED